MAEIKEFKLHQMVSPKSTTSARHMQTTVLIYIYIYIQSLTNRRQSLLRNLETRKRSDIRGVENKEWEPVLDHPSCEDLCCFIPRAEKCYGLGICLNDFSVQQFDCENIAAVCGHICISFAGVSSTTIRPMLSKECVSDE